VLFLLTLIVYAPVRSFDFVRYDDPGYVTDNVMVRFGLNSDSVRWAFTSPLGGFWQPLTALSHMADAQLFGLNPAGHHLTSVLIHALNAVLLFLFLNLATGSFWRSSFVAALFALHPVNVESVAWIAERKSVLSAMFWMLALIGYGWYAQKPSRQRELLVFALFALGLMSKAMVITLPFVLLLLDYWPLRRMPNEGSGFPTLRFPVSGLRSLLLEKLPLFFLVLAFALLTLRTQVDAGAVVPTSQFGIAYRLQFAVVHYVRYIQMLIWPAGLAPLYPQASTPPYVHTLLLALALLVALTIAALLYRKRLPYLLVGWLWFLGTLVPVIGIVMVGYHSIADRFLYIPAIGLFIIAAWGLVDIATRFPRTRLPITAAAALWLLLLAGSTRAQLGYWRDSASLFQRAVIVTEDNFIMCENLGRERIRQGRVEEAIALFRQAVEIQPAYLDARMNLALAYATKGERRSAIRLLKETAGVFPGNALVKRDIGMLLAESGQFDQASEYLQGALELDPNLGKAHYTLGMVFLKKGQKERARTHIEAAAALLPDHPQVQAALKRL